MCGTVLHHQALGHQLQSIWKILNLPLLLQQQLQRQLQRQLQHQMQEGEEFRPKHRRTSNGGEDCAKCCQEKSYQSLRDQEYR